MRSFVECALAGMFLGLSAGQTWTTVNVAAPPEACCTTGWASDAECNTLQTAIDAISDPSNAYTILSLASGTYCNKNLYKNGSTPTSFRNSKFVGVDGYTGIQIVAADDQNKPLIKTDGWSGI